MVILFVVVMFALMIGISYWRERSAVPAVDAAQVKPVAEPESHIFLHPSHTFARVAADGTIEVGMDEFARHAFGKIDKLHLPALDQKVKQGEIAWKATVAGRRFTQRIPVDGRVVAVNKSSNDWWLRIKPSRLQENLANLIDSASVVNWLKLARAQFLMQYSGSLVPAKPDGGELVEGFARHLTDEQWRAFCQEFFNCEN
jgi:glycine cleavage system H protein